jgi:2'-5' RNA ligase
MNKEAIQEQIQEAIREAKQELSRADHLFHVTLKYTRTVDVLKSVIERLINAFNFAMDALLLYAQMQGKLEKAPKIPLLKAETIKKIYADDKTVCDFQNFFILLRKIDKAKFDRDREYRRHVTMTAKVEDGDAEITIDIIGDYFRKTKEFVACVEELTSNKKG